MNTESRQPDWVSDCGTVTLYRGDCLELLKTLPDGSVDAVVTDPPYSSGGMVRGDRMATTRNKYQNAGVQIEHANFSGDNRDQRAFGYWCALWMSELRRIVRPGGMLCVFTDWRQLPSTTDSVQAGGWVWRGIVPWDKVLARPQPGRFRAQAEYMVWATNGPREFSTKNDPVYGAGVFRVCTPKDREHSTQKPVELLEEISKVVSPVGSTILDPFMGSGTTGVACVTTGRNVIGIELGSDYFDIAKRRIQHALAERGVFAQQGAA